MTNSIDTLTQDQFKQLLKPGVLFLYRWGDTKKPQTAPYLLVELLSPKGQWLGNEMPIMTLNFNGRYHEGSVVLPQIIGVYVNGNLVENPYRDLHQ